MLGAASTPAAERICVQREVSQQRWGEKGHAFQAEQDAFASSSLTLPFLESVNANLKSTLDV